MPRESLVRRGQRYTVLGWEHLRMENNVVPSMRIFAGTTVTVTIVQSGGTFGIHEDNGEWWWSLEMMEDTPVSAESISEPPNRITPEFAMLAFRVSKTVPVRGTYFDASARSGIVKADCFGAIFHAFSGEKWSLEALEKFIFLFWDESYVKGFNAGFDNHLHEPHPTDPPSVTIGVSDGIAVVNALRESGIEVLR